VSTVEILSGFLILFHERPRQTKANGKTYGEDDMVFPEEWKMQHISHDKDKDESDGEPQEKQGPRQDGFIHDIFP
jgi:hypothetical protein